VWIVLAIIAIIAVALAAIATFMAVREIIRDGAWKLF